MKKRCLAVFMVMVIFINIISGTVLVKAEQYLIETGIAFNQTQYLGDMFEISNSKLVYNGGGITTLYADVKNISDNEIGLIAINIYFYNSKGEMFKTFQGLISPSKSGGTVLLNAGISADWSNEDISYYRIEIKDTGEVSRGAEEIDTESSSMYFNGHQYQYFEGGISWYDAKVACENKEGYLLVISSQEEQDAVNTFMQSLYEKGKLSKQNIWLGANISNGVLTWLDNEESDYTNWSSDEPNNVFGQQDCVMMYTPLSVNGELGFWNDENGKGRDWEGFTLNDTGYICEWEIEEDDDENTDDEDNDDANVSNHKYQYFEGGISWYDAKKKCEELGGHLLVISSVEEQAYINSYVDELRQAGKLTKLNIWLGATVNNGVITWVNGEKTNYTNWATGEPNNYGDVENSLMMYTSLSNGNLGSWNDESGNGRNDGGAYTLSTMGYICEWDTDFKREDGFNFYLNYPTNCISVNEEVDLHIGYYLDGKIDSNTKGYIYTVTDSSIIDVVDNGWSDKYGQKLIIKAKKAGNATITVTNPHNEKSESLRIYVSNESGWTFDNVPKMTIEEGKVTNFYNYSGMVVDEFSYSEHKDADGNIDYYIVTMNVYNSENLYGAVTSHYSNGNLAGYCVIDKKVDYEKSFIDSLKSLYYNCGDIYYLIKNEYYYSGKSSTKETNVSIKVPVDGYLAISNNVLVSDVANMANFCGGIYDAAALLTDISEAEINEKLLDDVKKKIIEEVIDEILQEEVSDCLTEGVLEGFKDINLDHDNPVEAIIYIANKVHDFAMVDLVSLIEEKMASELGVASLGESIVTKILPTGWIIDAMYNVNKALDFVTWFNQYCRSKNKASGLFIYVPVTSLDHQSNGVIIDTDSGLKKTVVHAYTVADSEMAGINNNTFSDEVVYYSKKYQTYNITLYDSGVESQPETTVTVKIPIPDNFNRDSLKVYRNNEDGSLTDMNAYIADNYIVFETDHFSYYTLVDESESVLSTELKFAGASLTLQDNLVINYKINKSLMENGYSNPYIKFVFNDEEIFIKDYRILNDKYVFDFTDIAPNKMGDIIYATLYAEKNGTIYESETKEYSISSYCYNMLEQYSTEEYAEFRTLLVDLLNYGAASQNYTEYKVDDLVNVALTDKQMNWATSEIEEFTSVMDKEYEVVDNPSVTWKGASLYLQDSVEMLFKISTENIEDLKANIISESGNEWLIFSDNFKATDDGYYIYFDGLNACQMSEPVYLTIYDRETAVSNTVCYSIESYAYAKQNDSDEKLVNLIIAMMKYGNSAHAYID